MGNGASPTVAVLAGDGIGPEITAVARDVLAAVRPDVRFVDAPFGGAAIRSDGSAFPEQTRALAAGADAILLGAVGGPEWDDRAPQERPEYALLELRKTHGLFANLRPVAVDQPLASRSPLRAELVTGVDLLIVRELTGGAYFGEKHSGGERGARFASDAIVYREDEVVRVARVAFAAARARSKRVTSVDKANVLVTSRLWRTVVDEIARDYSDVELSHMLVDNAAMQLVRSPRAFDVVLTENMFGDILSDEAAMIAASIGNLPSASLGTRNTAHGTFGLYEPISGTAPDIAGRGIANPSGAIRSAAMLCRYSLSDETSAARIEAAVARAFADGLWTADLTSPQSPSLSTSRFGESVIARLDAHPAHAVSRRSSELV